MALPRRGSLHICTDPGPSRRVQDPGPSRRVQDPGPSRRVQDPGPSRRVQDPGPSRRVQDPGPSRRVQDAGRCIVYGNTPHAQYGVALVRRPYKENQQTNNNKKTHQQSTMKKKRNITVSRNRKGCSTALMINTGYTPPAEEI